MDILLRTVAISIEVVILAAIMYVLLTGVFLTIFDLGLGSRYKKMLAAVLIVAGGLFVAFFIGHLTSFYPMIPK